MQQQFLKYFENELEKIRNSLEDFEKLHPQKAKTLGISAGKSDDPNLQRLSDSFAFLAAGLSSQINQGYPKLAIDLMRLINPTTTIGTPGFCTVELGEHNQELPPTVKIKKGQEISVPISDGRECTFSIAHNTAIANLSISNLSFQAAPFTFGMPFEESEIKGALKFQLECNNSDEEISSLGISDIDFYLPQSSLRRNQLWKALTEDVAGISVTNPEDGKVFWLGSEKFFCKNIISDNNYLPELAVVGDGLEKLRDFLFYKEKFAFFSLDGVKDEFSLASTYKLEVRIFLKTQNTEPLVNVTEGDLKINVLPCINYFKRMSEPSEYSYARDRTTISPAKLARNEPIEVLKILDLYELSENGELKLPNMSSPDHSVQEDAVKWQELTELDQIDKSLATVSFSVFSDAIDSATTLQIVADVLCSNGDASSEPRSGNGAYLAVNGADPINFSILGEPAKPTPPDFSSKKYWDLLSLITNSINSFYDSESPKSWLKKTMNLCSQNGFSPEAEAIWDVKIKRSVAPLKVGQGMILATGNKVEIIILKENLNCAPFIFAYVLNSFLSSFVSYDRFLELSLKERGSSEPFIKLPRKHGSQK